MNSLEQLNKEGGTPEPGTRLNPKELEKEIQKKATEAGVHIGTNQIKKIVAQYNKGASLSKIWELVNKKIDHKEEILQKETEKQEAERLETEQKKEEDAKLEPWEREIKEKLATGWGINDERLASSEDYPDKEQEEYTAREEVDAFNKKGEMFDDSVPEAMMSLERAKGIRLETKSEEELLVKKKLLLKKIKIQTEELQKTRANVKDLGSGLIRHMENALGELYDQLAQVKEELEMEQSIILEKLRMAKAKGKKERSATTLEKTSQNENHGSKSETISGNKGIQNMETVEDTDSELEEYLKAQGAESENAVGLPKKNPSGNSEGATTQEENFDADFEEYLREATNKEAETMEKDWSEYLSENKEGQL